MTVLIKICGLSEPESIAAAVEAGADMIGLVFYPRSPRAVTPERAVELASGLRDGPVRVALAVDPDDALVDAIAGTGVVDLLQLHGGESPDRVAAIKRRTGLPAMKVLGVAGAADLAAVEVYETVADRLLLDAKPPKDRSGALPGGNGLTFDWTLLRGFRTGLPWILAGGLDAGNVAAAIRLTGAAGVDTSSGVEDRPGVKNPDKIRAFIAAARAVQEAA